MYTPINRIDILDDLEKKNAKFFSFSNHIKEKYQLNTDILRILDLISFEELLALKIEKSVDIFNGKFLLPFKEIYHSYINKAFFMLMSTYDETKNRKRIRSVTTLNRRTKFKIHQLYKNYTLGVEYNKND